MTARSVVCNASPLIALEQIARLDLLRQLFGNVLVPAAVIRETAPALVMPAWIAEQALGQPIEPRILQASLGPGETETVSLALEISADGSFSMSVRRGDWRRV